MLIKQGGEGDRNGFGYTEGELLILVPSGPTGSKTRTESRLEFSS